MQKITIALGKYLHQSGHATGIMICREKRSSHLSQAAGAVFSDAISGLQNLQQGAEVLSDGFKASHSKIDDVTPEDVRDWTDGFSLLNK